MYIVTAPLVVIADALGTKRYYYEGAILPGGLPSGELDRLAELGLIATVVDPPATGADPRAALDAASTALPRPPQVAAKGLWVDYAVSRGADRAQAEAMSKAELIDAYPPE